MKEIKNKNISNPSVVAMLVGGIFSVLINVSKQLAWVWATIAVIISFKSGNVGAIDAITRFASTIVNQESNLKISIFINISLTICGLFLLIQNSRLNNALEKLSSDIKYKKWRAK